MRTIVLYATKHGVTADIAWRIAERMDDAIDNNKIDEFIKAMTK